MTKRTIIVNSACAAALLVLLGAAIGIGLAGLGTLGTALGLAVAAAKALLIAVVFMELNRASGLVRLFAFAGLYWLAILMSITLADYLTRG